MFDGLLKSKFYSKCKSAIKLTKTRIEIIRRKRSAMQRYLKNDISDLLKNGLDFNAYGRAEGLLVELNMSSCYDFIEQYCLRVSSHLSIMTKQRECPEECREAIRSLMFAAARFADLPELRELRNIFSERYGSSLQPYVNKEFVEKLKSAPPTKDMKLQLIQDIALESGIEWDSKALEQKLYNPPTPEQDWSENNNYETSLEDPPTGGGGEGIETTKSIGPLDGEDNHEDGSVGEAKPIPRSVRWRHLKLPPIHDNAGSGKGHNQTNEEERAMDRPSIHYSSKQNDSEPGKIATALKPPTSRQGVVNASKGTKHGSKDGLRTRATFLSAEPTSPTEASKGHARATSFQLEMLSPTRHVHPMLPDYDDFVARLAALRGK